MKKPMTFFFAFIFALCLGGCDNNAASIGIIGGADGPTAVFVSSNINWLHVCGFVGLILGAVLVGAFIYRSKKKK